MAGKKTNKVEKSKNVGKPKTPKTARGKIKAGIDVNPVGRPRTKVENLRKDWAEVMEDLAGQGKGITAWMVALKLRNHSLTTLLEDSEKFRSTYELCLLKCKLWYEERGCDMIEGKGGSAAVWGLNMANRFGWNSSSKVEVSGNPAAPLQHEIKNKSLTKAELLEQLIERGLPTTFFMESDEAETQ